MHRNAHVVRGQLVLRGGLHGNAEFAVLEHGEQDETQQGRGADHDHLLNVEHQTTEVPDLVLVGNRQHMGFGGGLAGAGAFAG